jgi:hypothetical protein
VQLASLGCGLRGENGSCPRDRRRSPCHCPRRRIGLKRHFCIWRMCDRAKGFWLGAVTFGGLPGGDQIWVGARRGNGSFSAFAVRRHPLTGPAIQVHSSLGTYTPAKRYAMRNFPSPEDSRGSSHLPWLCNH